MNSKVTTKQLSVCMLQYEIVWEDIDSNLVQLDDMFQQVPEGTDLILLPETFSTGFTMRADLFAEGQEGKAVTWMQEKAAEKQSYVAGSVIIREKGQIYNRMFWVSPHGIEGHYDKRHLFRMGREDEHFAPGVARPIFKLGEFRFLPQICYDLRFPVFSRNRGDYDVMLYVANWPAPRQSVWDTLIRARAIENQSYVMAVSRVGVDGVGVDHLGGSSAIDPMGNVMFRLDDSPGVRSCTLSLNRLNDFRAKFPAWKDADRFTIE